MAALCRQGLLHTHCTAHNTHSSEWCSQYSARHLSTHTRSDVFSERVSSLLWREYSDQGPGAVINIGPPLTRGHNKEGNCIKLYRVRGGYGFTSEAMGRFLSVLFLACLNFLRELAGPIGVRGISLVYCCCNLEEMAPLGSQLKIARPGPGALTLQA